MPGELFHGMDVVAVRRAAEEMLTDAAQLGSLIRDVDTALDELPWVGQDADRFHDQWRGQFRTELRRTIDSLVRHGTELRDRAARQERASSQR